MGLCCENLPELGGLSESSVPKLTDLYYIMALHNK